MSAMIRPEVFRILITDDDRDIREGLREIVEAEGFDTLLASSGEEALEIVQAEPIHLVLLDMQMPRLTGLETFQLVRQINELLPAILITADATAQLIRQALNARVYSVIPKPVNKNIVVATMARALVRVYGELFAPPKAEPNSSPPETPGDSKR